MEVEFFGRLQYFLYAYCVALRESKNIIKVSDGNLGHPLILVYKITNINQNLNQTVPMDGGILMGGFSLGKIFFSIFFLHFIIAWIYENVTLKGFFEIRNTLKVLAFFVERCLWWVHTNTKFQTRLSRNHVFRTNGHDISSYTKPILMKRSAIDAELSPFWAEPQ